MRIYVSADEGRTLTGVRLLLIGFAVAAYACCALPFVYGGPHPWITVLVCIGIGTLFALPAALARNRTLQMWALVDGPNIAELLGALIAVIIGLATFVGWLLSFFK